MNGVVVIGCGVGGWAVLRAMARTRGIQRIALSAVPGEMGWHSRYADVRRICPHPGTEEEAFVEFLLAQAPAWEGALLLPAGDFMAAALSKHREALEKVYRVGIGPWDLVREFLEKDRLQVLAESAGVPVPRSVRVDPCATELAAKAVLDFPLWVKPVRSERFMRRFGVKGFLAKDRPALEALKVLMRDAGQPFLLQEVIPGPDALLERLDIYVSRNGELLARFPHNKFRQHPPGFGVMRAGYSVASNPEAEELAERLLHKLRDYRGFASFEFKRDPRDKKLKLIEVNVRVTRPGLLATAAGVNFPELIYADLVLGGAGLAPGARVGVWWIELLPDLYYTFLHKDGRQYSWEEKLRPYRAQHKVFGDFDPADLRPFVRQVIRGWRRWIVRRRPVGIRAWPR
ncbi:MAG: hypothetical protein N2379_07920 [Verrucomicrobiae bacterium]|nr:hypothetical protein [Verrucomicrobiae bacterium]